MLKWLLIVVGVIVALGAAIYGTGAMLPRTHVARMEGVVEKSPAALAAIIRDVRAYPSWRRGVVVEDVTEASDAITYIEVAEEDRIAYRLTEPASDSQFVATMTDPSLPFGGHWTITLTPEGAGTRVRIQEDGEVPRSHLSLLRALRVWLHLKHEELPRRLRRERHHRAGRLSHVGYRV